MELKGKNPSDSVNIDPFDIKGNDPLSKGTAQYFANFGSGAEGLVESPFESDYFNTKILGIDFGEVDNRAFNSKDFFDPFNPNIDFEKIRADKQSALAKTGALASQFVGKTLVGTVGNIIGGFYGLGKAIADGDSSKLYDNDVYRSLDEYNESLEKKNTAFVNNSDGLGFNAKTAKELTDAFSFIASAVVSETLMAGATGGVGFGGAALRLSKYLPKVGKIMRGIDKAQDVEAMALRLGRTVEDMSKFKRNIDAFVAAPLLTGRRLLTTTGYEAGIEARGASDEFIDKMTKELDYQLANDTSMSNEEKEVYRNERLKQINEDAGKVGLSTFISNTALLSVSNAVQFPTIFGNSFKKANYLSKIERKGIDNISKASANSSKVLNTINTLGRVLKNPTVEFLEETGQSAISSISQNYFETMLGDQTNIGVLSPTANNLANSLWEGLKDTYGTSEGLHEGIIGAIVGAIGLPGFKNRSVTWNGGIPGTIKEERRKRKYTEDALRILNSQPLSDVVNYNKDNAIRAAVDKQAEDLAVLNDNALELESTNDNKVFRYTIDRLSKGMDSFIQEDIAELRQMDPEQYREIFEKDDSFTEEDISNEIDAFEEKTKIYSDSYKAVHKRYNLNLMKDGPVNNKLSDILTYAVATEKIYGDKLEKAKQKLFDLNTEFTPEEIDSFVKTSAKVVDAKSILDGYVRSKNRQKEDVLKSELKTQLDPNYSYLLELDKSALEEHQRDLLNLEQSEVDQIQLKNVNKALELKDKFDGEVTSFNAKKSSVARKVQKDLDKITKDINKQINNKVSKSIEAISKPPSKITRKELEKYLEQRDKITESINKKFNSSSILDRITEDGDTNLIEEINFLSDKFTTATNIAGYLYGFKDNPSQLYSKVLVSELQANLSNALNQAHILNFIYLNDKRPSEELEIRLDELRNSLDILNTSYGKLNNNLNKNVKAQIDKQIDFIENVINDIENSIKVQEKLNKQEEQAVAEADNTTAEEEYDEDGLFDDIPLKEKVVDETIGTDTQKEIKAVNKSNNRFVIPEWYNKQNSAKPLKELIENGDIKVNDNVRLTVLEQEINPEDNKFLKDLLIKDNVLDKYNSDLSKLKLNSNAEAETFIKYAPINLKIFNKLKEITFDTYMFVPKEDSKSDKSNLRFREEVIRSYFNNFNELNLRVKNIDLGNFKDFKITKDIVEENLVEELGFNSQDIEIDDIYYTDQLGKYVRIDGIKTEDMPLNPLHGSVTKTTGKIYFLYTDIAGRKIPLKMNTKKLGLLEDNEVDYSNVIYDQLEKFFESDDKVEFRVINTGIPFIDKRKPDIRTFMSFFLKNRQNKTTEPIFLKNAYSIYKDKSGKSKFTLHDGELDLLTIKDTKELKERKNELITRIKNSRFTINNDWILNEDKSLNREVLKYIFDSRIINHSFDVTNNFNNIYEKGFEKSIQISDLTEDNIKTNINPKTSFDNALRKLRDILGAKNLTEKSFESNSDSINLSILNSIRESIGNITYDVTEKKVEQIVNSVIDNRIREINKVKKEFNTPNNTETLDKFIDFLESRRANLTTGPAITELKIKNSNITKTETIVKKELFDNNSGPIMPEDILLDTNEVPDFESKPRLNMNDYIKNNTVKNTLIRTFTTENELFNEGSLPQDMIDSRKKFLKEHNINDINGFAKILKAFENKSLVNKDINIKKYAEKLFNSEWPKDC